VSSYPYGLEALRRYREECAKNPPPEKLGVPLAEAQAEDDDAPLDLDGDDDATEDKFDDLFERWMDRIVEFQFGSCGSHTLEEESEAAG